MNEGIDRLSRGELGNVTGGIPYEKPGLILFSNKSSCIEGTYCNPGQDGPNTCNNGSICGGGSIVPDR